MNTSLHTSQAQFTDVLLALKGVGPKTAAKIVAVYPTFEEFNRVSVKDIAIQIHGVSLAGAKRIKSGLIASSLLVSTSALVIQKQQPKRLSLLAKIRESARLKAVGNMIYGILIAILVMVAGAIVFSLKPAPGGYQVFVVHSGSMEPSIKTGSLIVTGPQPSYQVGDVVTFVREPGANVNNLSNVVTHRIADINQKDGTTKYFTQGDANNSIDRQSVSGGQILGGVKLTIPYLGYVVRLARTQIGFVMLMIFPAFVIISGEVANIQKEIRKFALTRRSQRA